MATIRPSRSNSAFSTTARAALCVLVHADMTIALLIFTLATSAYVLIAIEFEDTAGSRFAETITSNKAGADP